MASDGVDEARLTGVSAVMRPVLDERQWRRLLGAEARGRGRGGIASVARASGAAESTVTSGVRELEREDCGGGLLPPGRSRRPGGGRKKAEDRDAGLRPALLELVEASTRGDPVSPLRRTALSLRGLERQLAVRGHRCGKDAVARILVNEGAEDDGKVIPAQAGTGPAGPAKGPVPALQDPRVPGVSDFPLRREPAARRAGKDTKEPAART
jgi:hypothetical protein